MAVRNFEADKEEEDCSMTDRYCRTERFVPNIVPEEDPDYIQALARYNRQMKLDEELETILDYSYWERKYGKLATFAGETRDFVFPRVGVLVRELVACLVLGGAALGLICIFLRVCGPVRIKALATGLALVIIGTVLVTGTPELAASIVTGMALSGYLFLVKVSTGFKCFRIPTPEPLRSAISRDEDPHSVFLFLHFWYVGHRTIWVHISKYENVIGLV